MMMSLNVRIMKTSKLMALVNQRVLLVHQIIYTQMTTKTARNASHSNRFLKIIYLALIWNVVTDKDGLLMELARDALHLDNYLKIRNNV